MKETDFVEQNKHKWHKFEKLSKQKNNDPDEVSELFTEITEDLSYARTFYPRRSVRVYLNQLAQGVFTKLYKQKKPKIGSFKKFWTEVVPLELYRSRYNMLSALIFFLIAIFIGVVSQHYDENFVKLILGDSYVSSTEARIENGDPMGIYGESGQVGMFFQITVNNIRVAFITFVLGILATLGSYFLLLKNGIMLGTFQYWFKTKGLLLTSFLTIWIHGAFEISAIVIAGGAGVTVGSGLLFPKSYTRLQSLVFSAKRGLLIMLSLIPVFIMAGFLESFVTRYYKEMSVALKMGIIFTSFALIILYYGVYPFIVAKKYPEKIKVKEVPRFIPDRKLEFYKIRNVGEFFSDSFYLFLTKIGQITSLFFKLVFPISMAIVAYLAVFKFYDFDFRLSTDDQFSILLGMGRDFNSISLFLWPIVLSLLMGVGFFSIDKTYESKSLFNFLKFIAKPFIWIYLFSLMVFAMCVFIPINFLVFVILILTAPILLLIPAYILIERQNFFKAFGNAFSFEKKSYADGIGNMFVFSIIGLIFFLILRNPLNISPLYLIDELLKDTLIINIEFYRVVINLVDMVIYVLFLSGMITLTSISAGLFYYSNTEKKQAKSLFERYKNFGKHSRIFETQADFE